MKNKHPTVNQIPYDPLTLPGYVPFLSSLKTRIRHAQTTASRAVNRELILLYWDIGQAIVEMQKSKGWVIP
jgi:hypothetical protein